MTTDPARPAPRPAPASAPTSATVQARGGPLGLVEWFHPGEHARVEWSLQRLRALGISRLRTHISWAEYVAEGGAAWYDWLLPRLAGEVELLPCVHFTPPSLSRTGRANGPPLVLKAYADFIDHLITRYRGRFDAVEIWNEPNNQLDWDWQQDQDWLLFCEMAGNAAHWIRARGLKALLGGPSPVDLNWLRLMGERGLFGSLDAVGLHGFPGTWDSEARSWRGWEALIGAVRDTVHAFNPRLELWITEAGYSTWRRDPFAQLGHFNDVLDLPVERVYWYGLQDVASNVAVQEGLHFDERQYHFGLHDEQGQPKLLGRLLASGGVPAVRAVLDAGLPRPALAGTRPTLVTGGAGFIGSNLADRLARSGEDVLVLDSLARPGVEENLHWLRRRHRGRLSVAIADLRDEGAIADAAHDASSVFHLAGQVAVTTSLVDPLRDFDVNLRGTVNLLEALRRRAARPGTEPVPLVFASTNKVYGDLADIQLSHNEDAYLPIDPVLRAHGIGEGRPLSFHTPYGCSKGAADQYVLDYARSFDLPAVVLRMSCIYGPRQLGTEDQGWLAHFLLSALQDRPLSLYGDGRQVRDALEVGDAVSAYLAARDRVQSSRDGAVRGQAFNLGGGPDNAITLLMLIEEIERLTGRRVQREFHPWRTGDQRYFVADTRRAQAALGLRQPLGWREGVARLCRWIETERPHLVSRSGLAEAGAAPVLGGAA